MLDEGADSAFVVIRFTLRLNLALVGQSDGNPLIEERQFAQAMLQNIKLIDGIRKNILIGDEMDLRSRFFRLADNRQGLHRNAAGESDLMNMAVTAHLDLH